MKGNIDNRLGEADRKECNENYFIRFTTLTAPTITKFIPGQVFVWKNLNFKHPKEWSTTSLEVVSIPCVSDAPKMFYFNRFLRGNKCLWTCKRMHISKLRTWNCNHHDEGIYRSKSCCSNHYSAAITRLFWIVSFWQSRACLFPILMLSYSTSQ